jgi:hypothetical protein
MEKPSLTLHLNILLKPPPHTPGPLCEVYRLVADAVFVANGHRLGIPSGGETPDGIRAAASATIIALGRAHEELLDAEICLGTNAPGVWEAGQAALEAVHPVM